MTYKIKIKEVNYATYEVDADSQEQAILNMETEYWKNPNDFLLEPQETEFTCVGEV